MSLAVDFMQNRTLVELFEVRRMIEPGATALAAGRITAEDLLLLEETLGRMDSAGCVEDLVEADDDFHRVIAGATGNAALAALLQNLYGRTLRARIWRGLAEEGAIDRTRISHRTIYDAISHRDAELARAAATMHIAEVEAWFRRQPEIQALAPPDGNGDPPKR
jgi:GntR family transcriptional repressor for pyruvate dehydrogenase complex